MSRAYFLLVTAGLLVAVSVTPAHAHHAYAAVYFLDQNKTIEGEVVEFRFLNPHSLVEIESPDPSGNRVRWIVEWGAGLQLDRTGVTRQSLKPGDHVIISGNPGRNLDEHRLRMLTIMRPSDGWKWEGRFY
jgi:hypothetical protein